MKDAVAQYGNPYFDVDRRVVRSGMWERLAKALNIFQKKPYIQPSVVSAVGFVSRAVRFRTRPLISVKAERNHQYMITEMYPLFLLPGDVPEKAIQVK